VNTMTPDRPTKGWLEFKGCNCPVCGHAGNCTRSADGMVVLCRRSRSDRVIRQKDGRDAYLHPMPGNAAAPAAAKDPVAKKKPSEWNVLHKRYVASLGPRKLEILARTLGLSETAMKLYGAGYDDYCDAYTFPMYGGDGKLCGIRRRWLNGDKNSVGGSDNGLFLPANYDHMAQPVPEGVCEGGTAPLVLLMPEGPTSAAAAADLGFRAVGRPSNTGGAKQILQLLRRHPKQDVVILADDEGTKWTKGNPPRPFWPGWEGALQLARDICMECERLWVVKVLDRQGAKVKDLRKFLQDGGNRAVFNAQVHRTVLGWPKGFDRYWIDGKFREVETWRGRLKPSPDVAA
jgi:hypothetical protein